MFGFINQRKMSPEQMFINFKLPHICTEHSGGKDQFKSGTTIECKSVPDLFQRLWNQFPGFIEYSLHLVATIIINYTKNRNNFSNIFRLTINLMMDSPSRQVFSIGLIFVLIWAIKAVKSSIPVTFQLFLNYISKFIPYCSERKIKF